MKGHEYGLTGEGFTKEEADELLAGFTPPPMTPEERREHLAMLRRAVALHKAESNGGANGTPVTRADLEREMKRQRACQDQGASE